MKNLGDFIKEKREEKSLTQGMLSYKTGIHRSSIQRIESNDAERINPKNLKAIAQALEVNYLTLFKLAGYIDDDALLDFSTNFINDKVKEKIEEHLDVISQDTSSTIPVYASASAGCARVADAEPVAFVNVPFKEYDCIGVKVHGDSMSPTITNDAIVILKKGAEVLSGEVGIFFVNDETFVKRFVEKDGIILLYSDNTCYEPIIVTKKDDFECCGKVIKTINKI